MTKLLIRPLRAFTIYALLLLCCSIPVYFYTIQYLWTDELDENNLIIKYRIQSYYLKHSIDNSEIKKTISNWQVVQPSIELNEVNSYPEKANDKFYFVTKEHNYTGTPETDRFRGLSSYITINGKPYHLIIETNVEDANGIFTSIGRVTIICFVLLFAGFIILHQRIAKKIWKPFQSTLSRLKLFDLTKQDKIHFEPTNIEEFQELNSELAKLMAKSRFDYQLQKTFIENAAHEIQTPLALLRSKIDSLLQTDAVTNEQVQIINSISIPLSRVSRIHKNMLLLAGIENRQFAAVEQITINSIVTENLEMLSDYIKEKNMTVRKSESAIIQVNCNKMLCDSLINNLLVNAIRYSKLNCIVIKIDQNKLTVENDGEGKLDEAVIFSRFSTSSDGAGGSGLGLSIVKEICKRYHWDLTYSFNNNQHQFTVTF